MFNICGQSTLRWLWWELGSWQAGWCRSSRRFPEKRRKIRQKVSSFDNGWRRKGKLTSTSSWWRHGHGLNSNVCSNYLIIVMSFRYTTTPAKPNLSPTLKNVARIHRHRMKKFSWNIEKVTHFNHSINIFSFCVSLTWLWLSSLTSWRLQPYLVSVSILTGAVRQVGRTSNPKKSGSTNRNRSKAFKDLPELLLLAALPGIERANSGRCLWKNWWCKGRQTKYFCITKICELYFLYYQQQCQHKDFPIPVSVYWTYNLEIFQLSQNWSLCDLQT